MAYPVQSRYLAPAPSPRVFPAGSTSSLVSPLNEIRPSQQTESYRSGTLDISDESLVNEWLSVTRNGFTSPTPFDNGHEFFTTKTSVRFSHPDWRFTFKSGSRAGWSMRGPLVPYAQLAHRQFVAAPRLTDAELRDYGARAIAATTPTRPEFSVAQFLGEVAEGLPQIVGASILRGRISDYRSLGSEYLNVQFGWLPFVSDLQKAVKALLNASQILSQYERDAGRIVRRRFAFPDEVETSFNENVTDPSGFLPVVGQNSGFVDNYLVKRPVVSQEINVRKSTWFSGAYQYALAVDDTVLGELQRFEQLANRLLGTRLTPATLWELTPWSWLTDWIGNIGLVLTNAESLSSDGLVLRYGYLMRHTVHQKTHRLGDLTFTSKVNPGPIYAVYRRETKERRRATPYGFALRPVDFSTRQWAILGALGLTKGPKTLP